MRKKIIYQIILFIEPIREKKLKPCISRGENILHGEKEYTLLSIWEKEVIAINVGKITSVDTFINLKGQVQASISIWHT